MGIFDFLKKKEEKIVEITLEEIPEFFETLADNQQIEQRVEDFKDNLHRKAELLDLALNRLESQGLMQDNIKGKERQVAESNKKAFVIRTRRFIKELPAPEEMKNLSKFFVELSEQIEELGHDTRKNKYISNQYFAHHLQEVLVLLNDLEKATIRMRELFESEHAQRVEKARTSYKTYKEAEEKIENLQQDLAVHKANVETKKETVNKLTEKIENLQNSRNYKEYEAIKSRIGNHTRIQEKISTPLTEILNTFSRALKRYGKKGKDSTLVTTYLRDPITSVLADKELKIVDLIKKLDLDKLEPKAKEREKMKEAVKNITKTSLQKVQKELREAEREAAQYMKRLDNHPGKMDNHEYKSRLDKAKQELKISEEELYKLTTTAERISLNLLKQEIKKDLKVFNAILK